MADEARLVRAALGPGRPGGDLDEISLVTQGRLHVSRILASRLGEGCCRESRSVVDTIEKPVTLSS